MQKHKSRAAAGPCCQASALNKWSGDNFIDSGTLPLPNNKIKVEKRVAAAIALRVCLAAGANPPSSSISELDLYPRALPALRESARIPCRQEVKRLLCVSVVSVSVCG